MTHYLYVYISLGKHDVSGRDQKDQTETGLSSLLGFLDKGKSSSNFSDNERKYLRKLLLNHFHQYKY